MVSIRETQRPVQPTEIFSRHDIAISGEPIKAPCLFFDHIKRPDLQEVITPLEPWTYWSAEFYGEGINGQGGLGMLASDTSSVAAKLKIPMDVITLFYRRERSHRVNNNFEQEIDVRDVSPEERGFRDTGIDVVVSTRTPPEVKLDVYVKKKGSVSIITITEPNIGELYEGDNYSDRRMYQNIVLGFGGYKALKALGLTPSMNQQLNEAPTVFATLARLDDHLSGVKDFKKALSDVRKKTIYTNHSNVPAAEPEFSLEQFEHFVMPNIKNEELKDWLRKKIIGKGGRIKLSVFAIELSGKKNGVSRAHAKDASIIYKDYDGKEVVFDAVTNGIDIDRWGDKGLLDIYRKNKAIDGFDLPTENYEVALEALSETELRVKKDKAKERLRKYLLGRKDQYGKAVDIKEGTKIFNWRRRLADYKRPGMLFENPEVLAWILESQNIDFVMAGNVHPNDGGMTRELKRILSAIDGNEILKRRVHFIQNYDEDLSKAISQGADVSVNTPTVRDENGNPKSTEACGTSVDKDMLNLVMIVSTNDGGMADPSLRAEKEGRTNFKQAYLEITGKNYKGEVVSLYGNLIRASQILDGDANISWGKFIKSQLSEYLPIISGARMKKDYINLGFPAPAPIPIAA